MEPSRRTEPQTSAAGEDPARPRAGLVSPALLLVFLASFGALTSFYLLLSVVPQYAVAMGAGSVGAGLATGALMFTTMATELATPRLVSWLGDRLVLGAGLLLLGVPALALPASSTLAGIVAVCVVRGVGFAIIVVVTSALVASLVPPARLGEALGLYGVVVGVPSVVALPLGLWLAAHAGYGFVFAAGAFTAVAGMAVLPGLPSGRAPGNRSVGLLVALRMPTLWRPSVVFASTAMAAGALMTFLPLALPRSSGNLAALALLVLSAAATVARWWAGHYGDRHVGTDLLGPAVLVTAGGTLALVPIGSVVAVMVAMLLAGAGFGVAQNASLTVMFAESGRVSHDMVSAVWNLAYDAGMGVGGTAFGVVVVHTGYPAAFALMSGLIAVVLAATWRGARHPPAGREEGPRPRS